MTEQANPDEMFIVLDLSVKLFLSTFPSTSLDPQIHPAHHQVLRPHRYLRRQNRPKNRCFPVPRVVLRLTRKRSHNRSQRLFRADLRVSLSFSRNRVESRSWLRAVSARG